MIMDASSCSPFGNDVFIGAPECSSADGLAAVIASCSPLGFNQGEVANNFPMVPESLGSSKFLGNFFPGLEDASVVQAGSTHDGSSRKRGLYSVLDEEAGDEEFSDEITAHQVEKKRRLSVEQVKALEKNFELENKLEPERKIQLARELGLQPRQVAVWFQNRRARWKTKQLEKDYDLLKSEFEDLKSSYMDLVKDKDLLQNEVARMQERLAEFRPPHANTVTKVKLELISSEAGEEQAIAGGSRKDQGSLSSESDASEVLEAELNSGAAQDRSSVVAAPGLGFLIHDQDNVHHHHHQSRLRGQVLKGEESGGSFEQDQCHGSGAFSWPWDWA